jgi:hypothetical protein
MSQDHIIAAAVADYTAKMRAEAAHKRPHARFLEALLAADWDDLDDVPVPNGVSTRIAEAMVEDVVWLKKPNERSRFPDAYIWQRIQDRRAAAARAKTNDRWLLP